MPQQTDNIMKDENDKPVHVPGIDKMEVVKGPDGTPVVPPTTDKPLNQTPKDTLPRPAPSQPMPEKEPEQTQVTVESKAVEGAITFEQLAAKKGFKSADDLAKSYVNLESQNKRVEVTLADAIQARLDTKTEVLKKEDIIEDLDNVDNKDAVKIINRMIDKKVSMTQDILDYQLHLIQNPKDKEIAAEAIKVVKENPGIKWKTAFAAAKSTFTGQTVEQAREDGKNEAYSNIEKKQDAQNIQGNQQRQITGDVSIKDVIEGVKTGKIRLSEARNIINSLNNDVR